MNETQVRACALSVQSVLAVGLLVYGSAFQDQRLRPEDSNDSTVTAASEFALNRAAAAGRLFRNPTGTLRIKASQACPT